MNCLSFNCRGLASAPKKLALKRLFKVELPDIILLQEKLGPGEAIYLSLNTLAARWKFLAIDADGRSGGLAIGYNPKSIRLDSSWGGQGFMGADIFLADLGLSLRIVNIYGPCQQRERFWRQFFNRNLMALDRIILGRDMNFSMGFRESWGSMVQVDTITEFMRNTLDQNDFIDIPMQKPLPTRRNRRVGASALARRLDRFLMKGPLIHQLHFYKQWVGTRGISDHSPILLEILGPHHKPKAPFKFNHVWLQDQDFTKLAKEKKAREDVQITHVEEELKVLLDERNLGFVTGDDKARLVELENQKNHILRQREESLRLRSGTTWLKAGDENSRLFHNYAKGRKVATLSGIYPYLKEVLRTPSTSSPSLERSTSELYTRTLLAQIWQKSSMWPLISLDL
eukprot:PITA_34258